MIQDSPEAGTRALILAEGGSPRLRPLTDHLPTSLVPVGGTPILDHQLQTLRRQGIRSISVLGGYRAAQVEQACRFYDDVVFRLNPAFSQSEPRLSSLEAAGGPGSAPWILVRGDLIFDGLLVRGLLEHERDDVRVVGTDGQGIGLCRLGPAASSDLWAAGRSEPGAEIPELFPFLDIFLEAREAAILEAGELPWARVGTMEDLARALQAHRETQRGLIARGAGRERSVTRSHLESSEPMRASTTSTGPDSRRARAADSDSSIKQRVSSAEGPV